MSEQVLDRLVTVVAAAVVGMVVFSLVLVLVPENPDSRTAVAGIVAGLVAVAGMLAMPLLLGFLARRRPVEPSPLPGQRDALVLGLVELLPQLPESLVWQAENALSKVGVRPVVPDGELLDPRRHHVVGTETPADAARVNTVARTVRPGYADGDRIVIHPKVVVYTMDELR